MFKGLIHLVPVAGVEVATTPLFKGYYDYGLHQVCA